MKKWMIFLALAALSTLLCASALAGSNPLTVATDGNGISVYTSSAGSRQAGLLYNGFSCELSLQPTDGLYSLFLTPECTVWLNQQKASKNLPAGWSLGSVNPGLEDILPCGAFLARVIQENAGLYAAPGGHLNARHAIGTLTAVWGEFGDYYYVQDPSWMIEGFMRKDALSRVKDLSYTQANRLDMGVESARQATVYAGDMPLMRAASATGYSDSASYWPLNTGDAVTVLAELGDWVQLTEGGFIEARFLDPDADHSRAYATVISDQLLNRLNVRSYAGSDASVVAKLCAGARVQVISHTDDWAYIFITGPSGGDSYSGCAQMKFLAFGDAAENVPSGFTRVRLTRDVYSGNGGHQYRISWSGGDALYAGTPLTVIGVRGGFFEDDPDLFLALTDAGRMVTIWNDGGLLEPIDSLGISAKAASSVKMRAFPSKEAPVIRTIDKGARVEVLLRGEGWTMVKYKNQTGCVMSRYLQFP